MKTYTSIIRFLLALPLLAQISLHAEQSAEAASKTLDDRPNVVFLMMDDQRGDTLGCYGRTDVLTPNIDKLAAEGVDLSHLVKGTQDMSQWRDAVLMENFFIEEIHTATRKKHPDIDALNKEIIAGNRSYRTQGVRSDRFKYFRYHEHDPVIEEFYDLNADPHEQPNLISNPEYADVLTQLRSKTQELYTLATN
ncbi:MULTISPECIES: sulfatase/phosphatase domain-containing protein [unclassified Lentimonas]|uniref:sulfatase/phosphatase domain-containing protein n=1 Tax=unclassified Lentimonas TaxID=2630993 RepID=UPI00132A1AD7|nr:MULTISPECIES: sulfatase/phosphatase domain-containing protein [unclassified Lentimonas]CAA6690013.1 Choline-sulfatase (EC [Lentimonas sp. CC10]CAA6691088.1 Choline-sulfatase (EC [Lentimonas sp. CC19]CAA7069298.1 Choline-sulfatase (EC [Lentimonas sp. CC11]